MDKKQLKKLLSDLLNEGQNFTFENYPKSKTSQLFGGDPPPQWSIWLHRVENICKTSFKNDSAINLLIGKGVITSQSIKGNGRKYFDVTKENLISGLELALAAIENDAHNELLGQSESAVSAFDSKDIFIVHGHNHEAKNELELFLKEIGLNPIVLHRKADEGQTIIEKFEKHSNVGYAVILLTPDDAVVSSGNITEEKEPDKMLFLNLAFLQVV